jgi:hypothetical protein
LRTKTTEFSLVWVKLLGTNSEDVEEEEEEEEEEEPKKERKREKLYWKIVLHYDIYVSFKLVFCKCSYSMAVEFIYCKRKSVLSEPSLSMVVKLGRNKKRFPCIPLNIYIYIYHRRISKVKSKTIKVNEK